MVSKMGNMAGVAKMLPGMGNMIDGNQMQEVEKRIKKQSSMVYSMTKKERANLNMLLTDKKPARGCCGLPRVPEWSSRRAWRSCPSFRKCAR